jgi:predicted metal-dependent hydrolase
MVVPLFRKSPRTATLDLGDFTVEVVFRAVRNLNLRVVPPGVVRISAPWYMSLKAVDEFARSKRDWIDKQRLRVRELDNEPGPEADDSLPLWGTRYPLRIEEGPSAPTVTIEGDEVVLRVRPGTSAARRQLAIDTWYREQVRAELPALLARWEPEMGVRSSSVVLQKMRSRWGTCQPGTGKIRLNSELAKKPRECLTYVVVHELAHLIEASHGPRFVAVMDRHLPQWPEIRRLLNGPAHAPFKNPSASS